LGIGFGGEQYGFGEAGNRSFPSTMRAFCVEPRWEAPEPGCNPTPHAGEYGSPQEIRVARRSLGATFAPRVDEIGGSGDAFAAQGESAPNSGCT
jgi:hypothetical protein